MPVPRRASTTTRARRPRRQDREPHFLETGAFYVMDAAGFRAAGHRFFGTDRHRRGRRERRDRDRHRRAAGDRPGDRAARRRRGCGRDRRRRRRHRLRRRAHRRHRRDRRRRPRDRPGQPLRRHGRRAAAARRRPGADPVDRDEPGRHARGRASCGSRCGRASTTRLAALRAWAAAAGHPARAHRLPRQRRQRPRVPRRSSAGPSRCPMRTRSCSPPRASSSPRPGGAGAVRDLAERVLRAREQPPQTIDPHAVPTRPKEARHDRDDRIPSGRRRTPRLRHRRDRPQPQRRRRDRQAAHRRRRRCRRRRGQVPEAHARDLDARAHARRCRARRRGAR